MAGSVLGDDASDYKLQIDCIDETLAAPNTNMSVLEVTQQFDKNPPTQDRRRLREGAEEHHHRRPRVCKGHVRYVASLVASTATS